MGSRAYTVLFVDDDQSVLRAVERTLRHSHYRVLLASSPQEALCALGTQAVDIVVSDERMPMMTGIELLGKVRQRFPHTVRILFTAHVDQRTLLRAINEGEVFRFIPKPYHPLELLDALKAASAKVGPNPPRAENALGRASWPVTIASGLRESATATTAAGSALSDQPGREEFEPNGTAVLQSESSNDEQQISILEADFSAAWEQNILGLKAAIREPSDFRRNRPSKAQAKDKSTGGCEPPNG